MEKVYAMLSQEPWCYSPETISRLTDWQIENLYAKPAAERADEFQRSSGQSGGSPSKTVAADMPEPGTARHRSLIMHALINGPFGMSPEAAKQEYERQLRQWESSKGGT